MNQFIEFLEAIKAGRKDHIVSLLDADPTVVQARTESGVSSILLASYCGRPDILEVLLRQKKDLDIYEAAAVGDKKALNRALNREPYLLNSYSPDGFTPLGLASYFNQREMAELLLLKGAKVNQASRNEIKMAPLHGAVSSGLVDIARILLEHGAKVNARQGAGYTPLHQAAYNGQLEMVELLVHHGAELEAHLPNGKTPLNLALEKSHQEVAELIRALLYG
jgi:uncharacterized protein